MFERAKALVFVLLLSPTLTFAAAKALLDRDQINLSESVNVEISTEKESAQNPDLSILEKDFDIGSMGKTVSVEMINGHVKHEARWVISLTPKHAGTLTIPSITMGSEKTQPVQLTVINKPIVHQSTEDFFIETALEPKEVYEQQAVVYTLQVWASKPLSNVQVTPPSVTDGVLLNPLDKQTNTLRNRGGHQYEVVERKYLITPDKVGSLTIHAPSLKGVTFDHNTARPFFMGGDPRSVYISGQDQKLSIKPKPAVWQGSWWTPANNLSLKEEWSQNLKSWQVGAPITRTITLQASGISASQLPEIRIDSPSGINTYPDKTETKNILSHNAVIGTRQIKIAYVPTQEGNLQLPAIKLPWWNLKTNKMEIAELTAINLSILPEASDVSTVPKTVIQSEVKTTSKTQITDPLAKKEITVSFPVAQWLLVSLVSLLFLSFIIIFFLWKKMNSKNAQLKKNSSRDSLLNISIKESINKIKKSCTENNPRKTLNATVAWARLRWPQAKINVLQDVSDLVSESEFSREVSTLLSSCYANQKTDWIGEKFWQVFEKYALSPRKKKETNIEDPLPSLNI